MTTSRSHLWFFWRFGAVSALFVACAPAQPRPSQNVPRPAASAAKSVDKPAPPKPKNKQAACDAGDGQACVDLAIEYFNGEKVPRDFEKARALDEKACNVGKTPEGC